MTLIRAGMVSSWTKASLVGVKDRMGDLGTINIDKCIKEKWGLSDGIEIFFIRR